MRVLILGTGDHAEVCAQTVLAMGHEIAGYMGLTNKRAPYDAYVEGDVADTTVIAEAARKVKADAGHAAFGDNGFRRKAGDAMDAAGLSAISLIHPTAQIDPTATIGAGVFIGPRSTVACHANLEKGALVNSGAIIEHDCKLGSYSAVFSGATLGGTVSIEASGMVGLGANVLPGITIGSGAIIGAGAVVTADIPPLSVCVGVPARAIRNRTNDEAYL